MELLSVTNEQIEAHFEKIEKAGIRTPRTEHARKVIQNLLETPKVSPRRDRANLAIEWFIKTQPGLELRHEFDAFLEETPEVDEYHRTARKFFIGGGGIEARDNYVWLLSKETDGLKQRWLGNHEDVPIQLVLIDGELGISAGSVMFL